jgi:hypothetical protein
MINVNLQKNNQTLYIFDKIFNSHSVYTFYTIEQIVQMGGLSFFNKFDHFFFLVTTS